MAKINTTSWGDFLVGELFDIHPTKAYKSNNCQLFEKDGTNPVVVNSSYNNGIGGYTNKPTTERGDMITFSDTTSADAIFYQELPFVGYAHVQGLYPIGKYKDEWTKNSLLFFVSVFKRKAIDSNYDYVNKFTRELAKNMLIRLPIVSSGDPNFSYMETYTKNLEITVGAAIAKFEN